MKQDHTLNHQTLNGLKNKEFVVPQANGKKTLLIQRLAVVVNPILQPHDRYDVLQPHIGCDILLAYTLHDVLQLHLAIQSQFSKLKKHFGRARNSGKHMDCRKKL